MASVIPELRREILGLQVRLYACRERLAAQTDTEALHDLRVAVRRLRSLLKPLKGTAGSELLQERARQLGRLSGPLRDLEVLVGQLRQAGLHDAVNRRLAELQHGYAAMAISPALAALFTALDAWPRELARQQAEGELDHLDQPVRRYLRKQRKRLLQALEDPQHDRHQVRLLVKRVRYTAEAYPYLAGVPRQQLKRLKQAQASIGDWHDLQQWLSRSEVEHDLQPLRESWSRSLQHAQGRADQVQARLLAALR